MRNRRIVGLLLAAVLGTMTTGCADVVHVTIDAAVDDLSAPPDLSRSPDLASACGPCAAPTPVCDPKSKRCVACLSDGDCPAATVCRNAACVPGCSPGHSECGDAGACDVDMGLCHGCLADADCKDAAAPFCDRVSGRCLGCDPNNDRCPDGKYCAPMGGGGGGASCVPGCKADVDCQQMGAQFRCCAHACADVTSDGANCGACGVGCGKGACCGGACANLDADPKNCGACKKACAAPNAVATCGAGMCGLGACSPGYANCNGNAADGCEISTDSDLNNCGACGKPCALPNAMALCIGGSCSLGACSGGYRNCDGMAANGCEVNANSDPNNCGACGSACAQLPHAQAGCMGGACVIGQCAPGFGNCDKLDGNGCEADLSQAPANCGACGNVCPAPPNVQTGCVAGKCTQGACNQGFADCDANPNNGCEVNLTNDVNNCGKCGTKCLGMGANAVAACAMSACTLSCNKGFADCNNNPADGCEKNTDTDPANCGMCGKACNVNETCVGGVCNASNCRNGAVKMSTSPGGDMVICDDPNDKVCEQDMATLCPANWRLCTPKQHANRRSGWNYALNQNGVPRLVVVGEISCRGANGAGGAGHFTIPDSNNVPNNVGSAAAFNCYFGSSRSTCVTGYGCNEQFAQALCCAPTPSCGNGKVDSPEEDCDDGNQDDTDACLSNCMWKNPVDHGLAGTNC